MEPLALYAQGADDANIITKIDYGGFWNAAALSADPVHERVRFRILRSPKGLALVGLAPRQHHRLNAKNFDRCGWYLDLESGALFSQAGDDRRPFLGVPVMTGSVVELRWERAKRSISIAVDGVAHGLAFRDIRVEDDQVLHGAVEMNEIGTAVQLLEVC